MWRTRTPKNTFLQVPKEHEDHGFVIAGNTGAGKSTILRQLLYQVKARGHSAVIHDPDRQFVEEFYDASRGDFILNPDDLRTPYWHPGYEVMSRTHALTMAQGILQAGEGENHFFVDHAQKILAYLLYGEYPQHPHHKPSAQDLSGILSSEKLVMAMVKGTPWQSALSSAAEQRSGIIGTLARIAYSLSLLPDEDDTRPFFSVRDWADDRRPWIFLTSTPTSQPALQPLHSLWLDMILLRLIDMGRRSDLPPVWLMLDELSSLQKLPQLERGITRLRKTGNVAVLAFQNKSQVDYVYGEKLSESILDQAGTTILLRQKGDKPSEWASRIIGQREIDLIRDTRAIGLHVGRDSQSISRTKEDVVMPSEIRALPDLHGYLLYLNHIVKIQVAQIPAVKRAEGLLPVATALPTSYSHGPVVEIEPEPEIEGQPETLTTSTGTAAEVKQETITW